ncbi:glycoside hydrolase family 3 C-terminal domain-containing protein [Flammeovirga sp. MY04]|uniref:glycoside hydrolase family 3 C-terminal domain-containing protein n=1 Tax=Flammeovirga sp. MY04 TaxID=1191459 RepID=UPI00080643D2|nr:glycoside hydrolase family 3 C-terminal domain-containing protein [Flammeovirga sp. MY04]
MKTNFLNQLKKHQYLFWLIFLMHSLSVSGQESDVDFSFYNTSLSISERSEILVSQMTIDEKIHQLVNSAPAIPRLNVPSYDWWNEALHGVARNGKATIFPQSIALAATFDDALALKVADAISSEALAKYHISQSVGNHSKYAGLTFWTPNVNIFRDPRWGRGQETYGEDPYLTSIMGVAFVKGLQGSDPNYLKTAACAKHFAVHSGPESLRHEFDATPSQKDLYETYLPAFEALVVDAKVEGVMGAYNAVFGKPSTASPFLLQTLLREQWGFDGYVTSDCGAIYSISSKFKFADSPAAGAAVALKAGTDLNCGKTYLQLSAALEQNLITEEVIHERTVQLFKTRFRLGMFDGDKKHIYSEMSPEMIHSDEHVALAREVAQKSIVLLKNKDNILPLSEDIKVPYVTGPFANSVDMLMGSYYGISPNMVTILEGIADAVPLGTSLNYRSGALPFHDNINSKNWAPFVSGESDVTICVVGITADMEGEEVDAIASQDTGDRVELALPQNQINYVKELAKHKKGPLVLIVASGSPVTLEEVEEHCDAILHIWYPGEQGGNAVADILFGKVSPSGKLPITFPKNVDQLPPFEDYSMKGRTYKFMEEDPQYPFGFGLSYASFNYHHLNLSKTKLKKEEDIEVSLQITNQSDIASDDVVQLYLIPQDISLPDTPKYILKRFKRVAVAPHETVDISFNLSSEDFKLFDEKGKKVRVKGNYKVVVGNALPSSRSVALGASEFVESVVTLK